MFKNQSIYNICHKSFGINLREGTLLRRLHLLSIVGGKFEPSGLMDELFRLDRSVGLSVLSVKQEPSVAVCQ